MTGNYDFPGKEHPAGGNRFCQFLGKWVEKRNIRNYRQSKYIPSNYLNGGARPDYGVCARCLKGPQWRPLSSDQSACFSLKTPGLCDLSSTLPLVHINPEKSSLREEQSHEAWY